MFTENFKSLLVLAQAGNKNLCNKSWQESTYPTCLTLTGCMHYFCGLETTHEDNYSERTEAENAELDDEHVSLQKQKNSTELLAAKETAAPRQCPWCCWLKEEVLLQKMFGSLFCAFVLFGVFSLQKE